MAKDLDKPIGDNLHRALNIMSYTKSTRAKALFLSHDTHKAFDRVSWSYLIQTLKWFKFGPNFIKWFQTLYTSPLASVRVNGYRSGSFALERGCRQGCLLSPLLFAISIEPFAQLIRDDSVIKGIIVGGEEHKLSLYADDVLLFLTKPETTIPYLKKLILNYGYYSGHKVNMDKTVAIDVNGQISKQIQIRSRFKWPKNGFKYLGTFIPSSFDQLYSTNYKKVISKY